MALAGIFRKFFGHRNKTVVLDGGKPSKHRHSSGRHKTAAEDKPVFEIVYSVAISEHTTLISGQVERGIFRTGDTIEICGAPENIPKLKTVIMEIRTVLVDVNRVGSGTQAEFVIEVCGDDAKNIMPGDRAYKIQEE